MDAVPSASHATPLERIARTMLSRTTLRIVTWVWLAVLIAGSLQTARLNVVASGTPHVALHWFAFGGLAFLSFTLSYTGRQEIVRAFAIFFLGLALEVLQYVINRKFMEWHDVRDDGLAILAVLAIYRLTGAWKPRGGG